MVQKLENTIHLLENRNEEITRKKWCWLTDSQHAKKLPPAAAVREGLPEEVICQQGPVRAGGQPRG